jgi:hypothetical protein
MNVIIAGSRCFTNDRLLCETLAPNDGAHAGGIGRQRRRSARGNLGAHAPGAVPSVPSRVATPGQGCRVLPQSPDGPGRRRAPSVLG